MLTLLSPCRLILLLSTSLLLGQAPLFAGEARIHCKANESERYALVIGNSAYSQGRDTFVPLPAVVADRTDVTKALCEMGFTVVVGDDQTLDEMKRAVMLLGGKRQNQLVVVYFSGHGLQYKGFNYLIPINASITAETIAKNSLDLRDIYDALDVLEPAKSREAVIILDACRSNRFSESGTVIPGLAIPSDAPPGITVAFATAPGTKALSPGQEDTQHSLYTEFLLKYLQQPGYTLPELFANVRRDLIKASERHQIPWENSSALTNVFLAKPIDVEWRVLAVDDMVEARIKGVPVLQATYPRQWEAIPLDILKPGRNPFEIRVYNDKTTNSDFKRQGWHYRVQVRFQHTAVYEFACKESEPPVLRWGQEFSVYSGFIDISSKGIVTVSPPSCMFEPF